MNHFGPFRTSLTSKRFSTKFSTQLSIPKLLLRCVQLQKSTQSMQKNLNKNWTFRPKISSTIQNLSKMWIRIRKRWMNLIQKKKVHLSNSKIHKTRFNSLGLSNRSWPRLNWNSVIFSSLWLRRKKKSNSFQVNFKLTTFKRISFCRKKRIYWRWKQILSWKPQN